MRKDASFNFSKASTNFDTTWFYPLIIVIVIPFYNLKITATPLYDAPITYVSVSLIINRISADLYESFLLRIGIFSFKDCSLHPVRRKWIPLATNYVADLNTNIEHKKAENPNENNLNKYCNLLPWACTPLLSCLLLNKAIQHAATYTCRYH